MRRFPFECIHPDDDDDDDDDDDEEHKRGLLRVKGAPLKYAKVMEPIEAVIGRFELRTNANAAEVIRSDKHLKQLQKIICPKCQKTKCIVDVKLKVKTAFSHVKCVCCGQITSSRDWSCLCAIKWSKKRYA